MARRGGFPGGMPGNMNNLMKQAQRMQRQMEENKKALEEKEFTASAGGGAVEVVISGKKELKSLTISPDAVDPDDVEMLQDMIIAAMGEATKQVDAESEKLFGGMGGGRSGSRRCGDAAGHDHRRYGRSYETGRRGEREALRRHGWFLTRGTIQRLYQQIDR